MIPASVQTPASPQTRRRGLALVASTAVGGPPNLSHDAHFQIDAMQARRMEMSTDLEQLLRRVLVAFNEHDLDAIMSHFAEDCVFESPRGPDRWGRRFVGKEEVRRGLAARFEGIPDVHYGDDDHFACGDRGVSEWTISGTTVHGEHIDVRGCDLWAFDAEGKIVRKDSFWKIRETR
jgi:ketosteroid isomerase-like protein